MSTSLRRYTIVTRCQESTELHYSLLVTVFMVFALVPRVRVIVMTVFAGVLVSVGVCVALVVEVVLVFVAVLVFVTMVVLMSVSIITMLVVMVMLVFMLVGMMMAMFMIAVHDDSSSLR